MKKIFSIKSILVLLIIAGIIFIISGISIYEDPDNREFIHGRENTVIDYEYEIKGFSYLFTGTIFIIAGLYLIVRLKELS